MQHGNGGVKRAARVAITRRRVEVAAIKPGITRNGDVWTIRVQIQKDGKPYDRKRRVTGIDLQRALTIQAEMRVELAHTQDNPVAEGTFSEYYDKWTAHLEATGKARATTMKVRKAVAKSLLTPFFGARQMTRINRRDIRSWMEWLSARRMEDGQEYSKDYLATAWRDLKALFSDARDLILLPENPTTDMDFSCKGKDPKPKDALTLEETRALLEATSAESDDIACMIWVAVTCGVRFGELTALTWKDIDFAKNIIHITKSQVAGDVGKTKTSRNRIAPLHPDAKTKLLEHQKQQTLEKVKQISNIVFPSEVGTYRFPSVLIKPLERCCTRASITKHITAHSLRRTCNNLVRVSLGDVAARKMLGHVSESQTARYSVVEAEELQQGQAQAFGSLVAQETQGQETGSFLGSVSCPSAPSEIVPTKPIRVAAKVAGKGR